MRKAPVKSVGGSQKVSVGSFCQMVRCVILFLMAVLFMLPTALFAQDEEVFKRSCVYVEYWTAADNARWRGENCDETGGGMTMEVNNLAGSSGKAYGYARAPFQSVHQVNVKAEATTDVAYVWGGGATAYADLLFFDKAADKFGDTGIATFCFSIEGGTHFDPEGSLIVEFVAGLYDPEYDYQEMVYFSEEYDFGDSYSKSVCGAAHYNIGLPLGLSQTFAVFARVGGYTGVEVEGHAEGDFLHTARMVSLTLSEGHYLAYAESGEPYPPEVDPPPPVATTTGTIGTQVTMDGPGFGNKKGKVLVGGAATKIIAWTDASITYEIKKGLPVGPYDVVVQRKDPKGAEPLTYEGAFTMAAPEIASIDPTSGIPNDQVVISGNYFGTKKGKLYIEDPATGKKKNCKVISWGMESITFAVPKLPNGLSTGAAYPLKLTNKAKETVETIFTVLEPEP